MDLSFRRVAGRFVLAAGVCAAVILVVRGNEKSSGMSLGDDTSWQVQAVQVGAIAAGFAALVAICGNGNCLLPWGGGADNLGPSPDLQIRPDNEPRPAR